MSEERDEQLANLFARHAPQADERAGKAADEQQFVARVSASVSRRRRRTIAIGVALIVAVLAVAAPFVPEVINAILGTLGLPTP